MWSEQNRHYKGRPPRYEPLPRPASLTAERERPRMSSPAEVLAFLASVRSA